MIKGFKRDTNLTSKDGAISYVSVDNEDNFFDIIEPDNNENYTIVLYYKNCERVMARLYDYNADLEKEIRNDCERLYDIR